MHYIQSEPSMPIETDLERVPKWGGRDLCRIALLMLVCLALTACHRAYSSPGRTYEDSLVEARDSRIYTLYPVEEPLAYRGLVYHPENKEDFVNLKKQRDARMKATAVLFKEKLQKESFERVNDLVYYLEVSSFDCHREPNVVCKSMTEHTGPKIVPWAGRAEGTGHCAEWTVMVLNSESLEQGLEVDAKVVDCYGYTE